MASRWLRWESSCALRHPPRVAVSVAVALGQIGEFSFILTTAGQGLGILDAHATSAVVAAGILSIALNPLLYRMIDRFERLVRHLLRLARYAPREDRPQDHEETEDERKRIRAVVVGHGPVGGSVTRLLKENLIEPVVIELNLETVRRLSAEGINAVYGDARHRQTLVQAHIGEALTLILSSSDSSGISETIRMARQLNPSIQIIARTSYVREAASLRRAGADRVFSSEGEVARAMIEFLMSRLGATDDQLAQQRQRATPNSSVTARPPPAGKPRFSRSRAIPLAKLPDRDPAQIAHQVNRHPQPLRPASAP